jgi:hypothetical protein
LCWFIPLVNYYTAQLFILLLSTLHSCWSLIWCFTLQHKCFFLQVANSAFFSKFWHVFITADFISAAHSLDKTWFKFFCSSYQDLSHITLHVLFACTHCLSLSPQNCTVFTNKYIVCVQTMLMCNNMKVCSFDHMAYEKYSLVVSWI